MMAKRLNNDPNEPDPRTLADLSALADGTLDPGRAAAVRELVSVSPELSQLYERERQAVTALHKLRADRAPARLRLSGAAVGRRVAPRPRIAPRVRLAYGGGLAVAVAAVLAAVILVLPGGAPGSPSVSQAAALSLRGPALPAPAPDRTWPRVRLGQEVQEVYFPNWSGRFGWSASGERIDRLGRQQSVTVYYARAGKQIAYTILASPALAWPGGATQWLYGVKLESFRAGGHLVVTWRRSGHTCVLSGTDVSIAELARLAAWKAPA